MQTGKTMAWADVMAFVRDRFWAILLRGAVSLVVVALLVALYMAFAPRTEGYRLELQVALPEQSGTLVYDNGTAFSVSDLVASPLLDDLWKSFGYAAKGVKFEDFSAAFTAGSWNKERAALDAELASKLAKRSITVTEINALQKAYEEKLASLDKHTVAITFRAKGLSTDRDKVSEMLGKLPELWALRVRRLYAPAIPELPASDSVREGLVRIARLLMAEFDTVEYLQQYCRQLRTTCDYIRKLARDQNIAKAGVNMGTLLARIDLAERELRQLYVLLVTGQGGSEKALNFIRGRRELLACDMLTMETRIAAVQSALDAFGQEARNRSGDGKKGPEGGVVLQADGNFLGQYAALVKDSAHADEVSRYMADKVALENEMADLKAHDLAYAQIEKTIAKNATATNKVDYSANLADLTKSVLQLGVATETFRDYVIENSRLPVDFYKVQAPVAYAKSYVFSLPRLAVGLLALWTLYNLFYVVAAWNARAE